MCANVSGPAVHIYQQEVPIWGQVLLGITATAAGLLMLTCLLLCCMRLCGCWSGNILGFGSLGRIHPEMGDHMGCWCCRPQYSPRIEHLENGGYVIQYKKNGRYHTT